MKVICVDNKNKPAEFPSTDTWLVEEQVYTPFKVSLLIGGVIGIQVEECIPSADNPFKYFKMDRFAIPEEYLEEFMNWVKESIEDQKPEDIDLGLEKVLVIEEEEKLIEV